MILLDWHARECPCSSSFLLPFCWSTDLQSGQMAFSWLRPAYWTCAGSLIGTPEILQSRPEPATSGRILLCCGVNDAPMCRCTICCKEKINTVYIYTHYILSLGNAAMLLILLNNTLLQLHCEDLLLTVFGTILGTKVTTYWLFHCDFHPRWCGRSLLGFLGICIAFAELFGFTLSCPSWVVPFGRNRSVRVVFFEVVARAWVFETAGFFAVDGDGHFGSILGTVWNF